MGGSRRIFLAPRDQQFMVSILCCDALLLRAPLRRFHWLLHDDIERDYEAENDREEVDRQRRDIGCSAVLESFQNVAKHCQRHSGAEYNEDREY